MYFYILFHALGYHHKHFTLVLILALISFYNFLSKKLRVFSGIFKWFSIPWNLISKTVYFLLHHFCIIGLKGCLYVFDINTSAVVNEYHVHIVFSFLKLYSWGTFPDRNVGTQILFTSKFIYNKVHKSVYNLKFYIHAYLCNSFRKFFQETFRAFKMY